MSTTIVKNQSSETYCIALTGETAYTIPKFGSRDSVMFKNLSEPVCTLTCNSGDTVDGSSTVVLKGYCSIELIRGTTEWVAVRGYDKRDTDSDSMDVEGDFSVTGTSTFIGPIAAYEATSKFGAISQPAALTTTTAIGSAFTNQPANDGIEVVSASALDVTQTVTIIGTTNGTDTVVVETVTLTGTTAVSTVKTDWGVVLAVKKSAATVGTVTVREASGDATITAGLTAAVLSVGVTAVDAANQAAYGRYLSLVSDGSTTKQIGLKGTNTSDAVIYDSQALTGTTTALSNSAFRTVTEIYRGDIEAARTATVTNDNDLDINGAPLGKTVTAYGVGTVYTFTNTATAVTFGTTNPSIVLDAAGTYLVSAQVHLAYAGATVVAETATLKVRRTNNTAADLSVVPVIDLPVSTTLTNSYGTVSIPPFVYTTTAVDDAVTIFANVSAALGAGTITATAIGTSLVAVRLK
ncbi:hypothetical protein UFOVP1007_7 [uncultured Caudovirales phage]|uniref:Uncharacterized protein n=2 Tax=uncultured Caudovirales phage TaxID=2100421 RepID=A0A6J5Q173_9CAUD|nr:hypothetical protein UFOVP1007_7 [uncultured Caudovirales phage]CAB4187206.1 hypothetical protein UFOVP1159_7 [uncultured Caudovirales phage]